MKIAQAGIDLIKTFEGCKLKAYQCSAGKWTIGYGNTQYENGLSVKQGDTATQERANELFGLILSKFDSAVSARLKRDVTQNQFDALVSFAYNCGIGNLEKSTLFAKVNKYPNDPTIGAEFMKWNKAGGKALAGLTRRRKAEYELYYQP